MIYLQYIVITIAIILALVYLGKRVRKTIFSKNDCDDDCGCGKK